MKAAQDLLLAVCLNCSGQNPNDKDVIVGLLKIRAKTKPVLSHYINCIRYDLLICIRYGGILVAFCLIESFNFEFVRILFLSNIIFFELIS